ncbi:hypothetical protein KR222_008974, partial [Zaprionus bogoriensis]
CFAEINGKMCTLGAILLILSFIQLGHCLPAAQSSYPVQLYHFIPVRLYTPQLLPDSDELRRSTRQQQIVQEVVVENNFGGGFELPPRIVPFPGFGGRPGIGPVHRFGGGFGGSLGGGFGGSLGGGFGGFGSLQSFRDAGNIERSYNQEEEPRKPAYSAPSVPSPACATSYVFSCEAVFRPVPCANPDASSC